MKIYKTKDYSVFGKILGNRKVVPQHVKRLADSILTQNMLEFNPIVVNKKMQIIDGQHRLEVAKVNNLDVYYTVIDNADLKDVQMLNANNRGWTAKDYLDSFIELGYDDYIYLADFMREFDLPLAISRALLSGGYRVGLQEFKDGLFKIKNVNNARIMAQRLKEIKPYVDLNVWKDREFIKALTESYKICGHRELIRKLNVTGVKITKERTPREYLRQIEYLYNFKRRQKIRIF